MSLNKVLLIGNVGKDPEVRHLEGGASVATITVATNERYKDRTSGEVRENTEWHTVVAWRQLADLAENYIRKGTQIYVEGSLRTRNYEANGVKRYVTEILADSIQLLGRREGGQGQMPQGGAYDPANAGRGSQPAPQPAPRPAPQPAVTPDPIEDDGSDDLPF